MLELLLAVKGVRSIKYWNVVELEALLPPGGHRRGSATAVHPPGLHLPRRLPQVLPAGQPPGEGRGAADAGGAEQREVVGEEPAGGAGGGGGQGPGSQQEEAVQLYDRRHTEHPTPTQRWCGASWA